MSLSIWQRTRRVHDAKIKNLIKARRDAFKAKLPAGDDLQTQAAKCREIAAQLDEAIRLENHNFQRAFTPRRQEKGSEPGAKRHLRPLDLVQAIKVERGNPSSSKRIRSGKILKRITKGVVGRLNRHGRAVT